jgi:DNA repair protein RadD
VAETPADERDAVIADFRFGRLQALVNVNILTVGFDVAEVDLIALLRPTLSVGLYVQMVGRGSRLASGKRNCLVLDFAANVRRHGPVDQADGKRKPWGKDGEAPTKTCPECNEIVAAAALECPACGHEFPSRPVVKHAPVADTTPIIGGPSEWLTVTETSARKHIKASDPDAPPSMRVDYLCGLSTYSEYLSFERGGFARDMARRWWGAMGGHGPIPQTVNDALNRLHELSPVLAIRIVRENKYWRVINRRVSRDGLEVNVDRWNYSSMPDMRPVKEIVDDEIRF